MRGVLGDGPGGSLFEIGPEGAQTRALKLLAQYFMDKGADDSLVNADGLTCYEGLTMEDVEKI